ncbi:hypothetical protein H7X69_01700, partial [Candidatus Saccharibacteria bacterium]|nr:hypothetical protein [Candidatus Saccharibacteria bacterium]
EWLRPYENVSLLHYFPAPDIAKGIIDLSDVVVYASLIVIFLLVAIAIFRRRDVR